MYQRTLVQFPNTPAWTKGMCNSNYRAFNVFRLVLLWDVCKQNLHTYNVKINIWKQGKCKLQSSLVCLGCIWRVVDPIFCSILSILQIPAEEQRAKAKNKNQVWKPAESSQWCARGKGLMKIPAPEPGVKQSIRRSNGRWAGQNHGGTTSWHQQNATNYFESLKHLTDSLLWPSGTGLFLMIPSCFKIAQAGYKLEIHLPQQRTSTGVYLTALSIIRIL